MGETFKSLNKDYAKDSKGGNRTPNLRLDGNLLGDLDWEDSGNGIEVGIFEGSQSEKADGHNKFTTRTNDLPKRRFIPKGRQKFIDEINDKVDEIVDRAIKKTDEGGPAPIPTTSTSVDLSSILGLSALDDEIRKRLGIK